MATVDSLFDSVDHKPSKAEILRGFVTDKLSAAAQEILAVVERTVAGYEEEAAGLRQEIERQRSHLESLLQPRVTLCRIDDQFPVCEPAAGGRGGGEFHEAEEQHKFEPYVEDSRRRDILGHADEEEGEDEGRSAEEPVQSTGLDREALRDQDHQIPNTRGQCVKRMYRSLGPPLHLKVGLLKDSHTNMLKKGVFESPVQILRCPQGLQESDFLDLLRSTFPQLTGQFDVLITDGTRKLTPLKVRTLTPEEIKTSIKSTGKGRSALYIRAKKAKTTLTSTEQLPPPQKKDEATSNAENDENGSHASSVEKVERSRSDRLSRYSRRQQQIDREADGERRGTTDGVSALSSVRSAAESEGDDGDDGDDDEVYEDYSDDDWKPEVEYTGSLDIQGHTEEDEGEESESAEDSDFQTPNSRGHSVKRQHRGRGFLNLRVGLLKDSHIDMLKKGVLKTPKQNLRCPRGLQEPDFVDLLRFTFPQLTGQFDVFTTDGTRKLTPLNVQTLTPEEIQRSLKSTGKGGSAMYIREKRAEKSPTSTEQLPPPQRKDEVTNNTRNDENRPYAKNSTVSVA